MEIAGKLAVVSGGASGIGRATVVALAERGARVLIADETRAGAIMTVTVGEGGKYVSAYCLRVVMRPRPEDP